MPLTFNLRHLDTKELHLTGELSAKELEIETSEDDVVHPGSPVKYDLNLQKLDDAILVRGEVLFSIDCDCVRCLKSFKQKLDLRDWTALLPLEGEEKIEVNNDSVDLTPYLREDILLALPQHPLCRPDCGGLPKNQTGEAKKPESSGENRWAELNKLKL